jgi:hypothetical protein
LGAGQIHAILLIDSKTLSGVCGYFSNSILFFGYQQ